MIINIQAVRFLAALSVVILHFDILNARPWFMVGEGGVDVFFVISGFIMVLTSWKSFGKQGSVSTFLWRRFIKIVPLYWLATAMLFGISLYVGAISLTKTPGLSSQILYGAFFIPLYDLPFLPPGWTLHYEVMFYILFGLSMWLPRRIAIPVASAAIIAAVTVGYFTTYSSHHGITFGFVRYWRGAIILEFVWGMIIGALYVRGFRLSNRVAVACLIAGFAGVIWSASTSAAHREFATGIPAAALIYAAISLPQIPSKAYLAKTFALLGDASYALYLFHWVLFSFVHTRSMILLVCIAILGSIAIHLLIEVPFLTWLRRGRKPIVTSSPIAVLADPPTLPT